MIKWQLVLLGLFVLALIGLVSHLMKKTEP